MLGRSKKQQQRVIIKLPVFAQFRTLRPNIVMYCCSVRLMLLLVANRLCAATVDLGTCSLSCDKNEDSVESPSISAQLSKLQDSVNALKKLSHSSDCIELKAVVKNSGTAVIFPFQATSMGVHVYCEQEVDDGGWIVIQRRQDGTEDFYRGWDDYVRGFGDKGSEFWLGLEVIHQLTQSGSYELRVDMEDFEGNKVYAKYRNFAVAGASDHYRLTVTGYSGNAGDAMAHQHNNQFSTKEYDRDHSPSEHCATKYKSGWWYNHCHRAHLNGIYKGTSSQGVAWYEWKGNHNNVAKRADMKIRRKTL